MAALERTRRDHKFARETTLRRRQRLIFDQRRVEEAERAEREAAAAMTSAERVVDLSAARARDSVDAATPHPPARVQHVHSRSERPGDEPFLDGSVSFMTSWAHVEFSSKLRTAVVAKASALRT